MLKIEQLQISYETFVLDLEEIEFPQGMNVILGPNGGGKSSLMKGVIGYGHEGLDRRKIQFGGHPLGKVEGVISYLPQENPRFRIRVGEYLTMTSGSVPERVLDEAVRHFELEPLLGQSIENLSGGEFKRVQCAQVALENKPVIMVDEMEQGLDMNYQHGMMKWLGSEAEGKVVVASMHDAALAMTYADTITLIKDGRAQGPMPSAAVTAEMLSGCYGLPLTVRRQEGVVLVYHNRL
ncbi:ABC transporter ATP-binding protein [Salinicoccus bachuensis]|uniref:ATP-binding cassette domain-containing protein n=1 Tax=Salinicoccus bachuensis TaxID=3136731 RepID=A0ABZ3CH30_9STAP